MLIILAATAPACLWLWYFYRLDKRPEPVGLVAMVFVAAGLTVYPVYHLETLLLPHLPAIEPGQSLTMLLTTTTLTAGAIEECAKFGVVLIVALWHHEFDEPVDGLVYAVASAMGFTTAEDFLRHMGGVEVGRIFSPPGHAMFAVFWGYALGQRMVHPGWTRVAIGLALSILVHGLWDAFVFYSIEDRHHHWVSAALFVMAVGLFWALESRLRAVQQETVADEEFPL
jgi:RsiW-degrading membrane proteinase PrsW (M82 family)